MKKFIKIILTILTIMTTSLLSLYVIAYLIGSPDLNKNRYLKLYDNNQQIYYQSINDYAGHYVSLDNVSQYFKDSIVAIEDRRFYQHRGFDPIGILRAIGASKKDISRVFNAETLIVGFTAGVIGIGVTVLLNIPINMIIAHLAGVENLSSLPIVGGIILIIISMLLTIIAGLIPARLASKKDPVESLRSE